MNSQELLRNEVKKLIRARKSRNPKFCQANLAKQLGINRITLNKFLTSKRILRRKTAAKYFQTVVGEDRWQRIEREFTREETASKNIEPYFLYKDIKDRPSLTDDQYHFNADPMHYALLFIFDLEDFEPTIPWMAERLSLSEEKLKEMLERLVRMGLVEEHEGDYFKKDVRVMSSDNVVNPATKQNHKKMLKHIEAAIDLGPESKDVFSWVCALDPKDIPKFKEQTRRSVKQFERLQLLSRPKRVYSFFISLVPLSK